MYNHARHLTDYSHVPLKPRILDFRYVVASDNGGDNKEEFSL